MDIFPAVFRWFTDPANWSGSGGVPSLLLEHLYYSLSATLLAIAIGLPIGVYVGHIGRFGTLAINISNIGRAIPSFGIIILAFFVAGLGFIPVLVALTALAIPPILTNTYVGVRSVDPDVRDSAEGMGLTGWQVLKEVEFPVALPLIMAGIRTSAVQVVATATLAAFIGSGGLGRPIIDGIALQNTAEVVAGAILVAAFAFAVEYALAGLQKAVVSDGLQARNAQESVAGGEQPDQMDAAAA